MIDRARRLDARAGAALIRAGIESLRGQRTRGIALLAEAVRLYGGAEMPLHAAYARHRLGQTQADEAGARAAAAADDDIRQRGIADPTLWLGLVAPGFGTARARAALGSANASELRRAATAACRRAPGSRRAA